MSQSAWNISPHNAGSVLNIVVTVLTPSMLVLFTSATYSICARVPSK